MNFALTQTSQVADQNGCCTSISCEQDWQRVHVLRETYDAIAVGANTWIKDSPQLTCRSEILGREPTKQPVRVIFSGETSCRIERESIDRKTIVVASKHKSGLPGKVINISGRKLAQPLHKLYQDGIQSLLVEGGPTLIRSFLEQGMIDTFTVYVSCKSYPDSIHALTKLFPELAADEISAESLGDGTLLTANFTQFEENTYLREVAV